MPLIRKPVIDKPAHGPTTVDVLRGLASADAEERWAAARAAPEVAGGAAALTTALRSESNARVREAMLTSLARINSPESVDAILALLRSDDASLRTGALDTLRAMGATVREHLLTLLADADSDVRVLSCEIARGLPGPEATRMLCDLLAREHEVNVCGAALDVLAEVGEAEALPVLAQCATRFRDTPFLTFAIQIATDRILAQSTRRRV
jgi:HEAT repeat protein